MCDAWAVPVGDARAVAEELKSQQRVLSLEWLDQIFVGGHWVPQT